MPTLLNKFLDLNWAQRRLLLRAWALLVYYRLLLRLVPFRRLKKHILHHPGARARTPRYDPRDILRSVRIAGRNHLTEMNCFPTALAARHLLCTEGFDAYLRIGVGRDEATGEFRAHAWLERDGHVVIGGAVSKHIYRTIVNTETSVSNA